MTVPPDHESIRQMMVAVVGEAVDARLKDIRDAVHQIMEALTGNGLGANYGLIERTRNLEKDLEHHTAEFHAFRQEQRDAWAKIKWTGAGIAIGAGAGTASLVVWLGKLLSS